MSDVYYRLGRTPGAVDWQRFLTAVGDHARCPAEVARELGLTFRKFRSDARWDPDRQAALDRALARRRVRIRLLNLTPAELLEVASIVEEIVGRRGGDVG